MVLVDKEAALQLSVVVDTERTGEAPALGLDGRLVICGLDRWRSFVGGKCGAERNRERNCQARGAGNAVKRQCRHSTGSARTAARRRLRRGRRRLLRPEHGFGDAARQRFRFLDPSDHRHHHEKEQEIVEQ